MAVKALKNPTEAQIRALVDESKYKAARRIQDPRSGDFYYWPAEQGTHRQGADYLMVPYDRPPGAGDIITFDD
jgi:hypothetical protein